MSRRSGGSTQAQRARLRKRDAAARKLKERLARASHDGAAVKLTRAERLLVKKGLVAHTETES